MVISLVICFVLSYFLFRFFGFGLSFFKFMRALLRATAVRVDFVAELSRRERERETNERTLPGFLIPSPSDLVLGSCNTLRAPGLEGSRGLRQNRKASLRAAAQAAAAAAVRHHVPSARTTV